MRRLAPLLLLALALPAAAQPAPKADGRRLAYVDEFDPYYPDRHFPRLVTPQWVGEDGVEAVVILAIDDMTQTQPYEAFLRPILRRLQKIDGRAPVSIMTCAADPQDPQLQTWLKEGLSIECHTFDHPCPFFKLGFAGARATYEKCVDLMHAIPHNRPVAFRMPCCDSLNTPSPRFWAEIFNKTTAQGNYLTIDSSVFNVFTADDPELPAELVKDAKGEDRFQKYLPLDRSFVNTIENYPYPYVIGKRCWEFPCMTPSDWQAQHRHKANNPITVADWKAALDCTVIKQGVFAMVFHPHGWIKNDQIVDLIDHAVAKHGKKVKFLTFREAQERLDRALFDGESLRRLLGTPGVTVRLDDARKSGFLGVTVTRSSGGAYAVTSRDWDARRKPPGWHTDRSKIALNPGGGPPPGQEHVVIHLPSADPSRGPLMVERKGDRAIVYDMRAGHDGPKFKELPFTLPAGARLRDEQGHDAGLRFVDLDGDGNVDVVFANEKEYGIYLFKDLKEGWSRKVSAGQAGDPGALPPIARNGTNNGFWVHSGSLWWSNEDTVLLRDHVDRRSVKELLRQVR